jgi:hypothetical protein
VLRRWIDCRFSKSITAENDAHSQSEVANACPERRDPKVFEANALIAEKILHWKGNFWGWWWHRSWRAQVRHSNSKWKRIWTSGTAAPAKILVVSGLKYQSRKLPTIQPLTTTRLFDATF